MTKRRNDRSHERRREVAVDWWMRRRAGPLGVAEQDAFDVWRADPANAAAYANIEGLCVHLATLPPPVEAPPLYARPRVWLLAAAPLAAACLAILAGWGDLVTFLRSDHYAGTGETRIVALEDGSRVQLDARSAIALRYGATERRIELIAGEAWFEVAPDATRPFVVTAAGGEIRALGTAFDVALDASGARVAVAEHSVRVTSGGTDVVVAQGERSAYRADAGPSRPEPAKSAWVGAWRRGKLIVENAPLRDVIAALGRHHHGVVACASAAICARAVTGVFGTQDPMQSLEALETALGLRLAVFSRFVAVFYE
ncbi:FecR family protein [Methylosinus sp. LW4]|uniref:FecR family protein n=1 Tax=Methylosinus sp. LW4 TaxID=136993 RepID=UPI0003A1EDC2|nr:FecR domain-containing protein [Methylosinus sp. LW4]